MRGTLPALKHLYMNINQIGDVGITALADALGKGGLTSLNVIYLDEIAPALDAACEVSTTTPSSELGAYCRSKSIMLNPKRFYLNHLLSTNQPCGYQLRCVVPQIIFTEF